MMKRNWKRIMICLLAALMVAFSFEDACGSYAAFAEAKEVQPAVSENEAGGENAGPQTDLEEDAADADFEGDAAEEDTAKAGADPGIGEGSPEDAADADSAEEIADEAMSEALPRKAAAKASAASWTGSDPISTVELFEGMGIASQFAVFANEFKNSNHMEGNIAVKTLTGSTSQIGVSDRVKSDITAWRATFHKEVVGTKAPKDFTFGVYKKSGNGYSLVKSTTIRTDASGTASGSLEGTFSNVTGDEYYLFEMDKDGKPIIGGQQAVEVKSGVYDVAYDEVYNRLNNAQPLIATNNTSYIETVGGNTGDYQEIDFYNHNGNDARGANLVIGSGNTVTKMTNDGEYKINDRLKINAAVTLETAGSPFPIDFATEMANLQALSARLANAKTTDDIEVINVTANTNGGNFSSSLRDAVNPSYSDGTNFAEHVGLANDNYLKNYASGKYVVINIDCTGLNDYEVSHIKVPSEASGLHPKDTFLQPEAGHIIYNFVTKSGNTYVPYTGHVMVKETTGTVLAPAATVTCHATISGSVYGNKVSHDGGEIHKKTLGAEVARGEVRVVNTNVGPEEEPEPADTEAEIGATKTIEADGQRLEDALKGNDFWFILSPMSFVSPEGTETTTGIPMPTEGLGSDGTAMAANQADGTISFGKITYENEGVYTYSLREWLPEGVDAANPSKDGVKYDLNTYYVRVVVVKDGNALKATTEYYRTLPQLQQAKGWKEYSGETKEVNLGRYYQKWYFPQTIPESVPENLFRYLTEYGTEKTTDINGQEVNRYWIYNDGTTEYLIDKGNYKQWTWKVWEERATWTSGDPLEAAPEFINEYRVVEMPETGSLGRLNCYLLGGLLMLAGMLILRRREDSQRI